jgi:large subunit ribosomal protein L18
LQVIDDAAGSTLAATSTLNPEIRQQLNGAGSNVEAAKLVGAKIAELCKQKNIEKVGGWRRALRGKQVELAS